MQAVFFIALFGLVFAVISSFTVGLSANSMQVKESKLDQAQQTLDNLEFAINNVVLKEKTDLRAEIPGLESGDMISLGEAELANFLPYMRNTSSDLVTDPWRTPINYFVFERETFLCSGQSADLKFECQVSAPVVYFLMVSAGPNRKFESGPNGDGTAPFTDPIAFLSYAKPIDSDDLIKVFNTDAPMRAHYNNMTLVEERVASLILKSYRDQSTAFFTSERVQEYIEDELEERIGNDGFFGDTPPTPSNPDSHSVMEFNQANSLRPMAAAAEEPPPPPCGDNCLPINITAEEVYGDLLELQEPRTWPGYPRMKGDYSGITDPGDDVAIDASAYGAQSELQHDPFCAVNSVGSCQPFLIYYDEDKPWQARIERRLNGADLGGWTISTTRTIDGKEDL